MISETKFSCISFVYLYVHLIQEHTIGKAWFSAVATLFNTQYEKVLDGTETLYELLSLVVQITKPTLTDGILERYGNAEVFQFMHANFHELTPISNWGYSYGQRLYNYNGLNQIEHIIEVLQSNISAKSATISLMDPSGDLRHTPCLTSLDFKVRHNTVYVTGFFRSQDIGKKLYADARELLLIGQHVADKLNIESVQLVHVISSAHVYENDCKNLLYILNLEGFTLPNNLNDFRL